MPPIGLGVCLGVGGGKPATSGGAPPAPAGCPPQPSYTYDLGVDAPDGCTLYGLTVRPAIHLDASDMNGNGDDNSGWSTADAVTTWADRSGNGNDVTQATSGYRPVYRTGLLRGMPGVEFDGTDDFLQDADFFDDVDNEPVDWSSETGTIVAVVIPGADGSGAFGETIGEGTTSYGTTDTSSNAGYGDIEFYTNGATYSGHFLNNRLAGTASNLTIIPPSTRPFINGVKVAGAGNYEIFYNKKANFSVALSGLASNAWGPDTTNGLKVGQSGGAKLKGYITELLIFNVILSSTDWDSVHAYLAQKYGMNVLAARPSGAYSIGSEEVSIAPQFHFDASEANTVLNSDYTTVTDGNPAYLWKDKVHGWYAPQPVAAKQPSFAENKINTNKHGVYFDGTGEAFELWMIQTLGNYLDADKAVFVVLEPVADDGDWSFLGIGLSPGGGYFSFTNEAKTYDSTFRYTKLNNLTLSNISTTGAQMIGIWSEEGEKYNITSGSDEDFCISEDGSTESWSTLSTKWGPAFTQIGGATRQPAEQSGQRFKGWIYEILIWDGGDGVLTAADKTALSDYATAKYGTL